MVNAGVICTWKVTLSFCLNEESEAMLSLLADCYTSRLECYIKINLTENTERATATSLHCN